MDVNDRNQQSQQQHSYLNHHPETTTTMFRRRQLVLGSNSNFVICSLLLVLCATLIPLSLASLTCTHSEYWDVKLDECVSCTKCNRQQIVIRPCQRHMDTVCQSINSIEIDWSKSLATEESRKVSRIRHRVEATKAYETFHEYFRNIIAQTGCHQRPPTTAMKSCCGIGNSFHSYWPSLPVCCSSLSPFSFPSITCDSGGKSKSSLILVSSFFGWQHSHFGYPTTNKQRRVLLAAESYKLMCQNTAQR